VHVHRRQPLNTEQKPIFSTSRNEVATSLDDGKTLNGHLKEEVSRRDTTEGNVWTTEIFRLLGNCILEQRRTIDYVLLLCLVRERWKWQNDSLTTVHGSLLLLSCEGRSSNNVQSSDSTSQKTKWVSIKRNLRVLLLMLWRKLTAVNSEMSHHGLRLVGKESGITFWTWILEVSDLPVCRKS
jgi:hypothetical protein